MKKVYVFGAGVALGVAATRRTRRAKEAAAAAMKAKLTPSAIAADIADAIAELGNAVGAFASDVRQGAVNPPGQLPPAGRQRQRGGGDGAAGGARPGSRADRTAHPRRPAADRPRTHTPAEPGPARDRSRRVRHSA